MSDDNETSAWLWAAIFILITLIAIALVTNGAQP